MILKYKAIFWVTDCILYLKVQLLHIVEFIRQIRFCDYIDY